MIREKVPLESSCGRKCNFMKPSRRFWHSILDRMLAIHRARMAAYSEPVCIFTPTCSEYMLKAIKIHGVFLGFILGYRRILRCSSGISSGGYDPVPPKET